MKADNILEVKKVTVKFDGFKVLDDLDFSIKRGEMRFLIGPNGAGKTTLLDIITGKVKSYKGIVKFTSSTISKHWRTRLRKNVFGSRLHRMTTEQGLVQAGISRKFQTPSVFPNLTVYENLEAAISYNEVYPRLLTMLAGEKKDKILDILETTGLQDKRDVIAGELSHGQKQWLEIALLLVQEPELLLLDEPVAGMSRGERDRTGELLSQINNRCSILVIEHDMLFVRQFASTVTVLHQGRVLREDDITVIQNDPEVKEIYLGHNVKDKTH